MIIGKPFRQPDIKMTKPVKLSSPFAMPSGPKRYNELNNTKSADYNNVNMEIKHNRFPYKKSNSVDENMIGGQIYSPNSAFDVKNQNASANDNSYSMNTNNLNFLEWDDKAKKILSSNDINLDDFPIPPVPKEFQKSVRLFMPSKREEMIKQCLADADRLVSNQEYDQAKELYLKVTRLDPYDPTVWRALGHIYLMQDRLLE